MNYSVDKLGIYLVEKEIISEQQFNLAADNTNRNAEYFKKFIIERGWISEEDFLTTIGEIYNIPKVQIDSYLIDKSIINIIPLSMARKYKVMPIVKIEDELAIAMSDPLDIYAIDALQYHTGCKLHISMTSQSEIDLAIARYYSLKDSMDQVVEGIDEHDLAAVERSTGTEISEDSDESSVIKLVNLVILQAIRDGASDIHFEPDEDVFRIRARIDGMLRELFLPPKNLQSMIVSRIKIMADMDVSERRLPQDGRFSLKVENKEIDFRASILPTVNGEKAVLRILDKTTSILSLRETGFSEEIYEKWVSLIKKTEGIVLITGPTGSGKTTTLYAVLNEINSKQKNVVTIENPVEYHFPYINQIQVNPKAGLTFANGLRSILRQDPDIIMVGEIRDRETAEIAIRSALTGHLVLSTLHTNDAPTAIARLIDMGLDAFLVEASLITVLAQRLVRLNCPRCKKKLMLTDRMIQNLNMPHWLHLNEVYQGKGCAECNYTGFKGRTTIHELLIVDESIRKLIISGASTEEIRQTARNNGMRTLRENGLQKVAQGITTIDEVLRVSYS